jgi:MraZ protein
MLTPFTFHGSHNRSVDTKGRFNLPIQFRVATEDKYMVSWGADGVLTLSPYLVWVDNFNRLRALPPTKELRIFLRNMSQTARVVEPDQQGRVAVTAEHLSKVGIERKIAIVGMGSYMELWDPQALDQLDTGTEGLDPEFMNEFFR